MGRGTTIIKVALQGRILFGADVNLLSRILIVHRLHTPTLAEIPSQLAQIDLRSEADIRDDLHAFYYPTTLREISGLRSYILAKEAVKKNSDGFEYPSTCRPPIYETIPLLNLLRLYFPSQCFFKDRENFD